MEASFRRSRRTASGSSYLVPASSTLTDGTYTVQASQTDSAGNTGLSVARTFTIDTAAPVTSSLVVGPSLTHVGPSISASVSDVGHGGNTIVAAEYHFIDVAGQRHGKRASRLERHVSPADRERQRQPLNTGDLQCLGRKGTHTIYVDAEDAAGNWSNTLDFGHVHQRHAWPRPHPESAASRPDAAKTSPRRSAASVSDAASGNSNIVAAEYFIDTTGAPGTGTALSGSFTSPTVTVKAGAMSQFQGCDLHERLEPRDAYDLCRRRGRRRQLEQSGVGHVHQGHAGPDRIRPHGRAQSDQCCPDY